MPFVDLKVNCYLEKKRKTSKELRCAAQSALSSRLSKPVICEKANVSTAIEMQEKQLKTHKESHNQTISKGGTNHMGKEGEYGPQKGEIVKV